MTTFQVRPQHKRIHTPVQKFVSDFLNSSLSDIADREFVYTRPSVNVLEKEDSFELFVAAPGLAKDQFSIEVENDVLLIRAEAPQTDPQDGINYKRREFNYSGFRRSFKLHPKLDAARIQAKYEAGILTIVIPKVEKRVNQIEIK